MNLDDLTILMRKTKKRGEGFSKKNDVIEIKLTERKRQASKR